MDALATYRSDSDDEGVQARPVPRAAAPHTQEARDSDSEDEPIDPADAFGLQHAASSRAAAPADAALVVQTAAPDVAEAPRSEEETAVTTATKTLSGTVEATNISAFDFKDQQRTFELLGYARNPSAYAAGSAATNAQAFVGDQLTAQAMGGASMAELRGGTAATRRASRAMRRKRKGREGDASVPEGTGAYVGPWGGWDDEVPASEFVPVDAADQAPVGPTPEEIAAAQAAAEKRKREATEYARRREKDEAHGTEKSIFHGESLYDYQGRTYMHIPTDAGVNLRGEPGSTESFLPEACIHTFTGHTKGITALRLFPQSGHLLLSASMDTKVKLWDVYHDGRCLRTFLGHSQAVKDITFSNDGRQFLTASYDNQVKLWDTESGACMQAVSYDDAPLCVRFNPDEDKQHIFLAGTNDKRIVQYDLRAREVTQEYNQHLGPVDSITFVDLNRRFVSTSDDKSLRAWDWDIPVPIKLVADPMMHAMPSVSVHPSLKWLACQTMNNSISVFSSDKFKARHKGFRGHTTAGFACEVGFSPDGRFISSGDSHGDLVFWDWKSGKELKRLSVHKDVVISHVWLPHETVRRRTDAVQNYHRRMGRPDQALGTWGELTQT